MKPADLDAREEGTVMESSGPESYVVWADIASSPKCLPRAAKKVSQTGHYLKAPRQPPEAM